MSNQVDPVAGALRTVWNDLRAQGLFWLVMLPLGAAGTMFSFLAEQAWQVNPYLTAGIVASLLVSFAGLIAMWFGREDWSALRERRRAAERRAEAMRNVLLKFERICALAPEGGLLPGWHCTATKFSSSFK